MRLYLQVTSCKDDLFTKFGIAPQARMAELDRQSLRLDAARRAHYKVTHCIEVVRPTAHCQSACLQPFRGCALERSRRTHEADSIR